ncbi:MAG: ABC transporter substrate-binding protein [Planctomycetota bacterium]|nr:ABC transporter substrate-binding protein [Planctomycetota bacterium]
MRKEFPSLVAVFLLCICGCAGMANPYASEEGLVVLHYSIGQDPKGFDPVRASDTLSSGLIGQIYEPLYQYAYLKRPYTIEPCLADGMPEISEDKCLYIIRIKKGVFFQDDPCFVATNGKGRELTAEDFIYSFKRLADTKNDPEGYWIFQGYIKGIDEFYEASQSESPTDYSKEIEGLKALDRYTLRIELNKPYPRLLWVLTMPYTAAVPHEAVEYYGEEVLNHPVGTGPFRLARWDHWHRIILERNPTFREEFYPSEGTAEDREQGLLRDAGKRLPLADRVVLTIIKQEQPAWLYFLSGYLDVSGIPKDNWNTAMSSLTTLSPQMEAKRITLWRERSFSVYYVAFNMNDSLIGMKHPEVCKREIEEKRKSAEEAREKGDSKEAERLDKEADELEKELPYLPQKNEKRRKLRQAMSLAYNRPQRIEIFANGRAEPAQGPIPPGFNGYDPNFKNPYSEYDIERAKLLLAEAGYPEGIGEDGKRLELSFETTGASTTVLQSADFFRQEMRKIGIVINIVQNTWTEFQEKLRTNRAQTYALGWIADYPDPENFLQLFYGPNKSPNPNNANYENPEYDRLYEEMAALSDFDPQEAKRKYELCRKMEHIVTEDCPWIFGLTYWSYTLNHCWLKNYKPHPFAYNTYKYHSVDPELRLRLSQEWNRPTMFPAYIILGVILSLAGLFFYKLKKQSE